MDAIKNSVMLIGNLGQDPKVITTQTGKTLTELSLATNESYKNSEGNWVTKTEWHRCIAWGKLAELLGNLCKKGQEIAVRGKLAYNIYEEDGKRRKLPQVVIADFSILSKKETKATEATAE
ncbi:MAG TPA: single-stranded DNA-binding protein [Phaeodactylibacter sp.]|nr:single-stranded DNA-binding protein [Phaeodactylibacter sp.]